MNYLDQEMQALKHTWTWWSDRLEQQTQLVRYGDYGMPLLLFPTAGGDAEELERQWVIQALAPFILERRLKVYAVDSIAGRTWTTDNNPVHCVWVQKQFDAYLRQEAVPAIRTDCLDSEIEIFVAGASIGAFNAIATLCRHPDVFSRVICLSGTYDLEKWLKGTWLDEFYYLSPVHFVPGLQEGEQLSRLRERQVVIATGEGRWESPEESWRLAHALGKKGIPNRVDLWGADYDHDWNTWREMLPKYVQDTLVHLGV